MTKRYCGMCDEWVKGRECPKCGADTEAPKKLTREEKLLGLADRGCDTWSEYREER